MILRIYDPQKQVDLMTIKSFQFSQIQVRSVTSVSLFVQIKFLSLRRSSASSEKMRKVSRIEHAYVMVKLRERCRNGPIVVRWRALRAEAPLISVKYE